jgi:hypothetical protein
VSLPYEKANAGDRALVEVQKVLAKFGCQSFGTMTEAEKGVTIVQFKWRNQVVALHASWKGYAQAWLKEHPYNYSYRVTKQEHERRALERGQLAVCSVLRDWVKGQITAVECGVLSFEAAFMPHMLLPSGERLIDKAVALLPAPIDNVVDLKK